MGILPNNVERILHNNQKKIQDAEILSENVFLSMNSAKKSACPSREHWLRCTAPLGCLGLTTLLSGHAAVCPTDQPSTDCNSRSFLQSYFSKSDSARKVPLCSFGGLMNRRKFCG